MRTLTCLAGAIFFLALAIGHATPPGLAAGAGAKRAGAWSPPKPVTPLFGICDAADVLDVLGDLSDPDPTKRRDQIALLQGRIVDCARKISAARPAPAATPYWVTAVPASPPAAAPANVCTDPPPATTQSNRFALFEILQRCATYWTTVSASASPAPSETAPPSIASRPTFYVFATGAVDPTTATVLIRSLVAALEDAHRRAGPGELEVAGRASWTSPDSFASQCRLDPNTRGALVIHTSLAETYRYNYFLLVSNFTNVAASVEVLGCGAEDHIPAASPLSLYTREASGKAHEDALTLGIFSSIAAFLATDKTRTTVTTGNGKTTITKSDSTAPVFTGSVLGYFEGENLNLPAQNASVQLRVASRRFTDTALARLRGLCVAPDVRNLAEQANPERRPPPPLEHRTLLYKAAFEYVNDCAQFANFATGT